MMVVDGIGLPLGVRLYAGSTHEVRLAEETVAAIRLVRWHGGGRPREIPRVAGQGGRRAMPRLRTLRGELPFGVEVSNRLTRTQEVFA
jgi:hypothetical protein